MVDVKIVKIWSNNNVSGEINGYPKENYNIVNSYEFNSTFWLCDK